MRFNTLVATAVAATVLSGGAANAAATLVAGYYFSDTLGSAVAGAAALTATDPLGQSAFVSDTVNGVVRTVYSVGGAADGPSQGGLTFNSTGLLNNTDGYSVALTLDFANTGGWRRILDVANRSTDNGFYVNPNSNLDVYGNAGTTAAYDNDGYNNIVLTVGDGAIKAYLKGGVSVSLVDNGVLNLPSNGLLNLFLDNTVGGGQNEWSPVKIATAEFYSGVLTAEQAAAFTGDIRQPPAGAVPEPASWALMIMGFGAAGAVLRRRHPRLAVH